jgi:hypothetical protein
MLKKVVENKENKHIKYDINFPKLPTDKSKFSLLIYQDYCKKHKKNIKLPNDLNNKLKILIKDLQKELI